MDMPLDRLQVIPLKKLWISTGLYRKSILLLEPFSTGICLQLDLLSTRFTQHSWLTTCESQETWSSLSLSLRQLENQRTMSSSIALIFRNLEILKSFPVKSFHFAISFWIGAFYQRVFSSTGSNIHNSKHYLRIVNNSKWFEIEIL